LTNLILLILMIY